MALTLSAQSISSAIITSQSLVVHAISVERQSRCLTDHSEDVRDDGSSFAVGVMIVHVLRRGSCTMMNAAKWRIAAGACAVAVAVAVCKQGPPLSQG